MESSIYDSDIKKKAKDKLVAIFEECKWSGESAMDHGIGHDFKKREISIEIDGETVIIYRNEFADDPDIGDEKADAIWLWVLGKSSTDLIPPAK